MTVQNKFTAKPTVYRGVTYRSRLEASFAEWLTDNGAKFDYEPGCFGTEKYLPDFSVRSKDGNQTFVEIKPICFCSEVWIAIRAAQQLKLDLMAIDSPRRGEFGCYAQVEEGELSFFASNLQMMLGLTFLEGTGSLCSVYYPGPFDSGQQPDEEIVETVEQPKPIVRINPYADPITDPPPARCEGWQKLIDLVRQRRPLIVSWLEPASSSVLWNVVQLRFPKSQKIAFESLSRPNNKKVLNECVAENYCDGYEIELILNDL